MKLQLFLEEQAVWCSIEQTELLTLLCRSEQIRLYSNSFVMKQTTRAVSFIANQTVDQLRLPVYHTNVVLCVAEEFVVICFDCIDNRMR